MMPEPNPMNELVKKTFWLVSFVKRWTVRFAVIWLCSIAIAQEIEPKQPAQNIPRDGSSAASEVKPEVSASDPDLQGSYEAARQSLGWMTRSLQQMADKLDSISSKLDPNASEEEINREVKRAMREAFADFLPVTSLPTPPIGPNSPVASNSSAESKSTEPKNANLNSPIWDPNTPAWVKDKVLDPEVVRMAIESTVESTSGEARSAMDQQMAALVSKVLDEHVLQHTQTSHIRQLTPEFLTGQLVKANTEYELVLDRPSGTYYQLWRLVHIGPDQLKQIRSWERESVTAKRVQWLGASAASALMILATASGVSGIMAKRSKGKTGSLKS